MNDKVVKLGEFDFEYEYTIYKNHDEELVKKIKALKKPDTFYLWNKSGKFKVNKALNDKQTLCINVQEGGLDEGGIQYEIIDSADIPELLRESFLLLINKTYPVQDNFLTNFGDVYTSRGKIVEVRCGFFGDNQPDNYKDVSVRYHNWEADKGSDAYVYEESHEGASNGFIFFNEDGNYVVRDYNQDLLELNRHNVDIPDREKEVEKFLSFFDKYETLEHLEGSTKWFTDEVCLHLWDEDEENWGLKIEVEIVEKRNGNRYFNSGNSYRKVIKPKKGLITVGPEHIKEYLRKIISEYK